MSRITTKTCRAFALAEVLIMPAMNMESRLADLAFQPSETRE